MARAKVGLIKDGYVQSRPKKLVRATESTVREPQLLATLLVRCTEGRVRGN